MELIIEESVGGPLPDGTPSPNIFADVMIVQFLLNQVKGAGTISPLLPLDGIATDDLNLAISVFELAQLAEPDSRFDPGDAEMQALNAIALSQFEGVTDRLEQLSIILRPLPEWNFTRGDFKTLTEFAALELRFDESSAWLPDALKSRLLVAFNALLDPSMKTAATWGVHPFDWYHCHLAVWSFKENVPISAEAEAYANLAAGLSRNLETFRLEFSVTGEIPLEKAEEFRVAYEARLQEDDVREVLETYASLDEAVMLHHTFEYPAWRPDMPSDDPRRHWMVTANEELVTAPYRTAMDLNAAQARQEFLMQRTIQINFLIDTSGIVRPVLGSFRDLSAVTGLGSASLIPPPAPEFPAPEPLP